MLRPSGGGRGIFLSHADSSKRQKLSIFDAQSTQSPGRPLIALTDDAHPSTASAAAVLAEKAAKGEVDPFDAFMAAMGTAGGAASATAPSVASGSERKEHQHPVMPVPAAADESKASQSAKEEEDPLDAFMKTLASQPPQAAGPAAAQPSAVRPSKPTRFDDDGYELTAGQGDDEDDLYELLGRRDDEDEDGDDEGAASPSDGDDNDSAPVRGKHIASLPPLDHAIIAYPPLPRPSYSPHSSLLPPLSPAVLAELSAYSFITTSPAHLTPPVPSFDLLPLPPALLSLLSSMAFTSPTPVQAQAIPLALLGFDLVCTAKTGSGKSLAFLIPLFLQLAAREEQGRRGKGGAGEGPMGLVVAPTRELGEQIFVVARRLSRVWGWRVAAVLGGSNKHEQYRQLLKGVDVVVATPGRLLDLITMGACSLFRCSFVVLDEADRMLSLGFEPQVRSIIGQIRPDRQSLLFSATIPPRVERLSRDVTKHNAVRIVVGTGGVVSDQVRQEVIIVKDEAAKLTWLRSNLPSLLTLSSVLVFTTTKASADSLAASLSSPRVTAVSLHGDQVQPQRMETMRRFKAGTLPVLVATDVAARGLDVKDLRVVVVWQVGRDKDSHVHRVGRVGRAGQEGRALTLLMEQDGGKGARIVMETMTEAGEEPPQELVELVARSADREGHRSAAGGKGRRGGRGGIGLRGRNVRNVMSAVPPPLDAVAETTPVPGFGMPCAPSSTFRRAEDAPPFAVPPSASAVVAGSTGAGSMHPARQQLLGLTPPLPASATPTPAATAPAIPTPASGTAPRRSRWDRPP